jgi:hypothetical protein
MFIHFCRRRLEEGCTQMDALPSVENRPTGISFGLRLPKSKPAEGVKNA